MIFDTSILIAAQRGRENAANLINKSAEKAISIITYMEFIQRAPDKKVFRLSKKFMNDLNFSILPLTPDISTTAAQLIEKYNLSHSLEIPDALIAATALENNLALATINYKHFKMIKNLELVKA